MLSRHQPRQRLAGLDHVAVADERQFIIGNGFGALIVVLARLPALVIRPAHFRVELDDAVEIVGGFGVALGRHQQRGARAQRVDILGLALEHGVIVGDCARRIALGLLDLRPRT